MKTALFIFLVAVACTTNIGYGMYHDEEHRHLKTIKTISGLIAAVSEVALVYMYVFK